MRFKRIISFLSACAAVLLLAYGSWLPARAGGVTALPKGTVGVAYCQQTISAQGATLTLSGNLPEGLSISSTGLISGTPGQAGEFSFSITVQAGVFTETHSYSLSVAPFAFLTKGLPDIIANEGYSFQLRLTTDKAAVFSLAEGALPEGLSLNADGRILGHSTGLSSPVNLVIAASVGDVSVRQAFTLHPSSASLGISAEGLFPSSVMTGEKNAFTLLLTGGSGKYSVSVSGSGKEGITAAVSGSQVDIAAVWPQAGNVSALITVTDLNDALKTTAYSLQTTVLAPVVADIFTDTPRAIEDSPVSWQMTASGGSGSYTYTVVDGSLPAGITLSSGGIFGGAGKAGTFAVTVRIADTVYPSLTAYNAIECTIFGKPILSPAVWPRGSSQLSVFVEGGLPPYTLTIVDASTDAALSSSSISPTAEDDAFLISVPEDAVGTLSILCADALLQETGITYSVDARRELVFTCSDIPQGTAGVAYDATLSFTHNMTEPVYFIIEGLPVGLTADDAGHITGTPTTSGSYALAITGTCEALETSSIINATLVINSTSAITVAPVSGLASVKVLPSDSSVYQMIPFSGAAEAKFTVTATDAAAQLSWNGSAIHSGDTLTQSVGDKTTASGNLALVLGGETYTYTLVFAVPGESIQITGLPPVVYENTSFTLTVVSIPEQAFITPVEWEYDTSNISHTGSNPASFIAKSSGTYTVKATVKDSYGKELSAAQQFRANVAVSETTSAPATRRPSINPTVRITSKPTATPVPTPTPKPDVTLIPHATDAPQDDSVDPDLDFSSPSPSLSPEGTPPSSMTPGPDSTQFPGDSQKRGAPVWLWPLLVSSLILIPSVIFLILRNIRMRNQPIMEPSDELKVVDRFKLPSEVEEDPAGPQPSGQDTADKDSFDEDKQ